MNRTKELSSTFITLGYVMIIILFALYIYLFISLNMESHLDAAAILGLGILLFLLPTIYAIRINKKNIENIEKSEVYEEEYKKSLKGADKSLALELGRKYYGSLRENGRVTIYDEQAITNDLNSMKITVHVVDNETLKIQGGVSNQKTLYCSKCGKDYVPNENKKFCEECGNKYY
jgi:hypothetical protein